MTLALGMQPSSPPPPPQQVEVTGLVRTRESTVLGLLPRAAPANYSREELQELERRLNNLGIFDYVSVSSSPSKVLVIVREKWTLIPQVELATGSTWRDTSALVGALEYNLFGYANQFAFNVVRAERGWGVNAAFTEHPYERARWALLAGLSFGTAEKSFDDGTGWRLAYGGAELGLLSPTWLSDYLSYGVGGYYGREVVTSSFTSVHPSASHAAGNRIAFVWDEYRWEDLAPRGVRAELGAEVGLSAAGASLRPRHAARLTIDAALRFTPTAALAMRGAAFVNTRGNPNYSQTIGSVSGVRGLRDGYYFNWVQAFANVELRQSYRFAKRWAIQGVAFCDVGVFEQLDATGNRGRPGGAISFGGGVRLVPTWLSTIVLRVDLARLLIPEERWLLQVGLNQYF